MLPALNIGPFVFPTAGLTIIFGAYLALSLVERAARRLRQPVEPYYGLASTSLLVGIIGARLAFVVLYWSAFQENLLSIIWPLNTGYNMWGGLFFAAAAAFFYGRFRQLSPARTLDILAPGLLTGLMVMSLADLLAGPGYGTLTTLPWGINFFGVRRHPVQLYEILLGIEAIVIWFQLARRSTPHNGYLFLVVTAVYASGRLFLDTFRATAWFTTGGWHGLQIITLLIALTCLGLLAWRSQKPAPSLPDPN
ncbi:MAG: prolipoprotein diacylglyceryl transferase [Anaerolineales bacterium]|nr:prolipoprotein diacylglyceryl transferase [Anaerolineales bacterium]